MNPPPATDPRFAHFFDESKFEETDRPGFRRRVIVGEHLELWFWRITGGGEGSILPRHDANDEFNEVRILDVFAPPRSAPRPMSTEA